MVGKIDPGGSKQKVVIWLVGGASTAAAGYVLYEYWLKHYIREKLTGLTDTTTAAYQILKTLAAASDLSSTVVQDLTQFLGSDADELPRSVRQMLKLTRSLEFQQALLSSSQFVTQGVLQGLTPPAAPRSQSSEKPSKGFIEAVMEKLFTEEGKSFASAVCSRMVRTLVSSLQMQTPGQAKQISGSDVASQRPGVDSQTWQAVLVNLLTTERGKQLVTTVVQTFAVHGIGTFLDKTADVNMYHDMLVAASKNPELVKDLSSHLLSHTVREAVYQWRRGGRMSTPQEFATASSVSSFSSSPRAGEVQLAPFSESESELSSKLQQPQESSLAAEMGHCLSQPAIRSFMLDATGVMTMKGMEAFLLVLMSQVFGGPNLPALDCSGAPTTSDRCAMQGKQWSTTSRLIASRALAAGSVCLAIMLHYMSLQ